MKKNKSTTRLTAPAYPNAASKQYVFSKFMDIVTAVASGTGFLTVLLFFLLM